MEEYHILDNKTDEVLKPHFEKCIAEGRRLLDAAEKEQNFGCALVVLVFNPGKNNEGYRARGMNYGDPLIVMSGLRDCALGLVRNTVESMKGGGNEPAH